MIPIMDPVVDLTHVTNGDFSDLWSQWGDSLAYVLAEINFVISVSFLPPSQHHSLLPETETFCQHRATI